MSRLKSNGGTIERITRALAKESVPIVDFPVLAYYKWARCRISSVALTNLDSMGVYNVIESKGFEQEEIHNLLLKGGLIGLAAEYPYLMMRVTAKSREVRRIILSDSPDCLEVLS